MSTDGKNNLILIATLFGPLIAVGVALMGLGSYQNRIAADESNIAQLTSQQRSDHDLLLPMKVELDDLHEWLKNKSLDSQKSGK